VPTTNVQPDSIHDRVARVIQLIRPTIQADGGDIELVGITDEGIVQVRLLGNCQGCPSSGVTLKAGVERNLKAHCPEVKGVRPVE
jgi:Fe-S cluster biogenesis protein NfuA